MKRLVFEINECNDCPYFSGGVHLGRIRAFCAKPGMCLRLPADGMCEDDVDPDSIEIPEWCPLPERVDE